MDLQISSSSPTVIYRYLFFFLFLLVLCTLVRGFFFNYVFQWCSVVVYCITVMRSKDGESVCKIGLPCITE